MRRTTMRWWVIPGLLLLLAGCGDQSGIPQPFPLPKPNVQLLRAAGAADTGADEPVEVVGLPGAVTRAGEVILDNRGQSVKVQATAAGSFVAEVRARPDDEIAVRFETSDPAQLKVIKLGIQTPPPPKPIPGTPPVSGPVGGVLTVRGQGNPDVDIFVVNMDDGAVGVGHTAQSDGAFTLTVGGASGDTLRVYEDRTPLSGYWEITAP